MRHTKDARHDGCTEHQGASIRQTLRSLNDGSLVPRDSNAALVFTKYENGDAHAFVQNLPRPPELHEFSLFVRTEQAIDNL